MSDEPEFMLTSAQPKRKSAEFDDNEQCRQKALFAGLNALPGQIDLFSVDGEPDQFPPASA